MFSIILKHTLLLVGFVLRKSSISRHSTPYLDCGQLITTLPFIPSQSSFFAQSGYNREPVSQRKFGKGCGLDWEVISNSVVLGVHSEHGASGSALSSSTRLLRRWLESVVNVVWCWPVPMGARGGRGFVRLEKTIT